jgi:hypothetical protein
VPFIVYPSCLTGTCRGISLWTKAPRNGLKPGRHKFSNATSSYDTSCKDQPVAKSILGLRQIALGAGYLLIFDFRGYAHHPSKESLYVGWGIRKG